MAIIGEMRQLTIGGKTYTLPTYSLPIASSSTLGGIKVGSGLSIDPSTGTLTATGTSITIDTTMSDSSTNAVQNKVIKGYADGLIAALDGGTIGTPGAGKTLTALSQTNGQVSATFSNISITKSQVSDFPTNVSAFTNDAGYITTHQDISGKVDTQHTFSDGTGAIQYNSEEEAILLYRESESENSGVEIYTNSVGLYSSNGSNLSVSNAGVFIASTATSGVRIFNVATPTNATDAVNKQYVDNLISTNTPAQASINSTGLITYKNSGGTSLFTLQLPLYNGGVS